MIDLIFYYGTEIVFVRVLGTKVTFASSSNGALYAPLSGLRLNKEGCIKEFPDLIDREDWKDESLKRWQDKIDNLGSEEAVVDFIVEDLKKHGYIPKFKQKQGFRRQKIGN